MPITPTYPGVYVEEIPSGVRTITGVATSITAFIGRAARGEVNEPVTINNFGDFEGLFGGLDAHYPMSYAVRDFYLNGGGQAIIVRLFAGGVAAVDAGKATLTIGSDFKLEASSPGTWGNSLQVKVDDDGITSDIAASYGLGQADLFLTIRYTADGSEQRVLAEERIRNVSVKGSPRKVDRVLAQESQLVRIQGNLPTNPPSPTGADGGGTPSGAASGGAGGGAPSGGGASGNGAGTAVLTQLASRAATEDKKFEKFAADGKDSDLLGQTETNYTGDLDAKTGLFALVAHHYDRGG